MDIKSDNSLCKGCKTWFDGTAGYCSVKNHNNECPCTKCLVKPMCENACTKYFMFYDKYKREVRAQREIRLLDI